VRGTHAQVCPQEWDPVLSLREEQSEDCLSLNVYAPTVESEEAAAGVRDKLPVVSLAQVSALTPEAAGQRGG
jgi:carboxylesterase type B